METLLQEEVGDLEVRVHPDEDPESPRTCDNPSVMLCWHRRYNLGDYKVLKEEFPTPESFSDWWQKKHAHKKTSFRLPLGLLDHSGLHMWVGDGPHFTDQAGWDSGQIGWIYSTRETRKACGVKDAMAVEAMKSEVEVYDKHLRGETSGYIIVKKCKCDNCDDDHEETLDSCWGYEDADLALREGVAHAKTLVTEKTS